MSKQRREFGLAKWGLSYAQAVAHTRTFILAVLTREIRVRYALLLLIVVLATSLVSASLYAQGGSAVTVSSRTDGGDTSIFAPLDIPPVPNTIRSTTGAPGPQYWQNRTDYDLSATLDTATSLVRGTMTVRYTNHSPTTLTVVWLQTERNAPSAALGAATQATDHGSAREVGMGNTIDQFDQIVAGKAVPLTLEDHGTLIKVTLAYPLASGKIVTFAGRWHVLIPAHRGALYEVTRWYPKLCVYDDVRGWNTDAWVDDQGSYHDYGDVTLHLTVPANYLVAATGTLANPQAVLTSAERTRLAAAVHADTVVHIVTASEIANGAAHAARTGMVTWIFHATMISDAAWAASADYQWDASNWRGILIQTYYRPDQATEWATTIDQMRMSLQEYAGRLSPYPYPQLSAVSGPIVSATSAMISFNGDDPTPLGFFRNITQNVDQNWFPLLVGSNGQLHSWQDGGPSQFLSTFGEARYYSGRSQGTIIVPYLQVLEGSTAVFATPVDRPATQGGGETYAMSQLLKPAVALHILRQTVLGPSVFDSALRTYVTRWTFKHPTPADFFRTMNAVSGRQLDWFWREWFLASAQFDQGIETVMVRGDKSAEQLTVHYANNARGVLPLLVRFTFADGTTQDLVYPADIWRANHHSYVQDYTFSKHVTRIELDPDRQLVDLDRNNNNWVAP